MVRRLVSLNKGIPRGILIGFIEGQGFDSSSVRTALEERRIYNEWTIYKEDDWATREEYRRNQDLSNEIEINRWVLNLEGAVRWMRGVDQAILEKLVVL